MNPQPLAQMPRDLPIRGLLFDIDDTFTTDGKMSGEAFSALQAWQQSGRLAIAVTGRPAGWCDHIARMWPVDAVVGENGAFWFCFDSRLRKMQRHVVVTQGEQRQREEALESICQAVQKKVPAARIAADQAYRLSDLAIDFAEDCGPLSLDSAQEIARIMQGFGMTVKISSIHVNGWFGNFDKLSTTRLLAKQQFGVAAAELSKSFVYLGDSPNDSPMFSFFERSVGVANVVRYQGVMEHWPRYICTQESAAGFTEALRFLLQEPAR